MKNWYDLTKEEQKQYKKEFKKKQNVIDLRVLLYFISICIFFIFIVLFISQNRGTCYWENCQFVVIKWFMYFLIPFLSAIINSIMISRRDKDFKLWLKSRKIEK